MRHLVGCARIGRHTRWPGPRAEVRVSRRIEDDRRPPRRFLLRGCHCLAARHVSRCTYRSKGRACRRAHQSGRDRPTTSRSRRRRRQPRHRVELESRQGLVRSWSCPCRVHLHNRYCQIGAFEFTDAPSRELLARQLSTHYACGLHGRTRGMASVTSAEKFSKTCYLPEQREGDSNPRGY
jgi:hypothetical protein